MVIPDWRLPGFVKTLLNLHDTRRIKREYYTHNKANLSIFRSNNYPEITDLICRLPYTCTLIYIYNHLRKELRILIEILPKTFRSENLSSNCHITTTFLWEWYSNCIVKINFDIDFDNNTKGGQLIWFILKIPVLNISCIREPRLNVHMRMVLNIGFEVNYTC